MRKILIYPIEFYQRWLRWLLPQSCRFVPSCSEYARQALAQYGVIKGLYMGCKRVLACHPYSKRSIYDPPEPKTNG